MTGKVRFSIQQPPGKIVLKRVEADWANQLLFTVYRKGDRDGMLEVQSALDGKKLISHGFSNPNTMRDLRVLTHPKSKHVIVISDKYLKVWNIQPVGYVKRLELAPKPPIGVIHSFCFVENADTGLACLAKNQSGGLSLLDLKKEGTQETKQPSFGTVNGSHYATFVSSADGKTVAFSRTAKSGARELQICRLENGTFTGVIQKATGVYENRFQMSPSGKTLWQGMSFIDAETLSTLVGIDRAGMNAVEEPTSTRWVGEDRVVEIAVPRAAESEDDEETLSRVLLLWSTAGGKPIATSGAPNAVAVAASPDASFIVEAGSDLRMRIRDSRTLKIVRELRVHDAPLTAVAWHPHLPLIATASEDHSVKIWDLRTDKMVEKLSLFLDLPNGLYWSPDGKSLAVQHTDSSTFVDIFRPESCR
jgi:WD40 repeat protein